MAPKREEDRRRVCPDDEQLAAWIDGKLPPDQRATVDRHLLECPACALLVCRVRDTMQRVYAHRTHRRVH
jgi:anti-sigma factor RsiW